MDEPRSGMGRRSGELTKRTLSALALIPLALLVTWWGGVVFLLAVAGVAVLSLREWTRIATADAPAWLFPAATAALVASLGAVHLDRPGWAAVLLGGTAAAMFLAGSRNQTFLWSGLGFLYAALPAAALLLLRGGDGGLFAVLFLAAVIWSGDVAAYFGGRRIGGPRLWPRVSPKKTISGAVCGLVASILVGVVAAALAGAGPLPTAAAIAALLGVAGQAGDLLESAVKRRFSVKDSGSLIPGHGGVLDRFDALFAAAIVAALLAMAGAGGPLPPLGAAQ